MTKKSLEENPKSLTYLITTSILKSNVF